MGGGGGVGWGGVWGCDRGGTLGWSNLRLVMSDFDDSWWKFFVQVFSSIWAGLLAYSVKENVRKNEKLRFKVLIFMKCCYF